MMLFAIHDVIDCVFYLVYGVCVLNILWYTNFYGFFTLAVYRLFLLIFVLVYNLNLFVLAGLLFQRSAYIDKSVNNVRK